MVIFLKIENEVSDSSDPCEGRKFYDVGHCRVQWFSFLALGSEVLGDRVCVVPTLRLAASDSGDASHSSSETQVTVSTRLLPPRGYSAILLSVFIQS